MTVLAPPPSARPALSPAARALRIQRVFARLQEGASYQDIAAEEGLSRERLRQIVRAATARGKEPPDHKRMQFARLEPALRLVARGVADGDVKAIPLLLKLVDRLDRYCDPGDFNASPLLYDLAPRPRRRRRRGRAPQPGEAATADRSDAQTPPGQIASIAAEPVSASEATKQSRGCVTQPLDCFASLAMTGFLSEPTP